MWFKLQSVDMLFLLWFLPALAALWIYAAYRRKEALAKFAGTHLAGKINISANARMRLWKGVIVSAAVVFLVIGLARPGWNPKPDTIHQRSRDVVFVLDVSRSMLADDLAPNRLERARMSIKDCVERLRGDRVALVAFAGNAVVKCPLTLDYGFFRMILDDIGPDSVTRGGTAIGDALRAVMRDVLDSREKDGKDIILITDGEDHDSFPVEAAKAAGEKGVRIIAIGLGSETDGRRVPVVDERGNRQYLVHGGQQVWSKLDSSTLQKMAAATPGGRYLGVGTGAMDLGDIYSTLVATADKKMLESRTITRYEERFQVFLVIAFLLLAAESLVPERKKEARQS